MKSLRLHELGEGQRRCNLGEKGQVRLFFNAMKTAGGTLPQQAAAPTPPIVMAAPETELTAASANAVALNGTVTTVGDKVARRISVAEEGELHKTYKRATGGRVRTRGDANARSAERLQPVADAGRHRGRGLRRVGAA